VHCQIQKFGEMVRDFDCGICFMSGHFVMIEVLKEGRCSWFYLCCRMDAEVRRIELVRGRR
jgi:hypothetical protein